LSVQCAAHTANPYHAGSVGIHNVDGKHFWAKLPLFTAVLYTIIPRLLLHVAVHSIVVEANKNTEQRDVASGGASKSCGTKLIISLPCDNIHLATLRQHPSRYLATTSIEGRVEQDMHMTCGTYAASSPSAPWIRQPPDVEGELGVAHEEDAINSSEEAVGTATGEYASGDADNLP
jgi:hypothetical protein